MLQSAVDEVMAVLCFSCLRCRCLRRMRTATRARARMMVGIATPAAIAAVLEDDDFGPGDDAAFWLP